MRSIGFAPAGSGDRLREAGAALILSDLAELDLRLAHESPSWTGGEVGSNPWLLRYDGFDQQPKDYAKLEHSPERVRIVRDCAQPDCALVVVLRGVHA